ncbi:hypothetical protein TrVGV298_003786 [Trichoderma virens]|nr:hypothetical protein TrVGV298_003786 [Trichoderma virens]
MPQDSTQNQQAAFSALYLQKLTQELSEDLDKIRNADDFKAESNAVLKTSESRHG